jgi:cytochrome P450
VFEKHMSNLMDSWRAKHFKPNSTRSESFEPLAGCGETAIAVILHLVFGVDVSLPEFADADVTRALPAFRGFFAAFGWRVRQPVPWYKYFKTKLVKQQDAAAATVRKFVRDRLVDAQSKADGVDAPLSMLAAINESELSDVDKMANLTQIALAGSDTTANTMAWLPW